LQRPAVGQELVADLRTGRQAIPWLPYVLRDSPGCPVPASGVGAAALATRLSAVGLPARLEEHALHTSVEAEVPGSLSAESWRQVLEVVAEADRFGLLATSLYDRTLWAVVRKAVPTTGDVGRPSHQRQELNSVLNRIRRAVSLTGERHLPKGRHRRPLASTRPSPVNAPPAPTEGPTKYGDGAQTGQTARTR
jgi:hypothetical protein